jgi:hypothetical protein
VKICLLAHLACINDKLFVVGWGAELNRISFICNESEVRKVYAVLVVTLKLRDYLGVYA